MRPAALHIDPDITRAETPPARLYTDPAVFDALVERVFTRSWHYVGHLGEVPGPGTVAPRTLGPGTLDEPVLLVRDGGGVVRVLSNVCTHRGMRMLEEDGPVRNIRCGYHGRRFGLDGRLEAAPGFEGAADFPRPCDDLPALATGRFGPLVFASLDPEQPFDAWLSPVRTRMAFLDEGRLEAFPDRDRDFDVAAPWAAYCDNYLEGMHIPYVHPSLADALDVKAYRVELFEQASLQVGVAAPGEAAFELPPEHPYAGERVGGLYFFLFPNLMLNFYPWGVSLNLVEPRGVRRTQVRFRSFVADAACLGGGAGADLVAVELEDEAVVERVAEGLSGRLYRRGRYAPRHEAAVHHFHRLLTARL